MTQKSKSRKTNKNLSMAKFLLNNTAMCFTTGDGYCRLYSLKTLKPIVVTPPIQRIFETTAFKWHVFIAGLGKTEINSTTVDDYIKGDLIVSPDYYLHSELAPKLDELHSEVNLRIPEHQFIGAGWIATPFPRDISEELAFNLFKTMGAFKRKRDKETGEVYVVE